MQRKRGKTFFIGLWCNGNTADSGPAFPGSSPGSPTPLKQRKQGWSLAAKTKKRLGYGVMVTLQILVLPFLVRVRVAQQKRESYIGFSFFIFVAFSTDLGAIAGCPLRNRIGRNPTA